MAARDPGVVRLCGRRAGNFVGALPLHHDVAAASPGASPKRTPTQSRSTSDNADGAQPSCSAASAQTVLQTADASSCTAAERALFAVLAAQRAARRWVGHRRTVSVRAVTQCTAVVLSHADMRWAVAHDYRQSDELAKALKKRKLSVVKAIRAERAAK